MKTVFNHQTSSEIVRFVQLSDCHLFAEKSEQLLGVNTFNSFKAVLSAIEQRNFAYEFLLATGDIVQDGTRLAYRYFCEEVMPLNKPTFWISGNHDYQPYMVEEFNQHSLILPFKHILINQHWQILMLDSQMLGVSHGYLNPYQLDWLKAKLTQYPDRFTLIVLHHHLAPTNSAWLDQHNLRNTSEFLSCLQKHQHIKAIISGHIHQTMDCYWQNYRIITTPSTCIQFNPDSHHFSLSTLAPGWREFTLYPDGNIETEVKRITSNDFQPDFNVSGY